MLPNAFRMITLTKSLLFVCVIISQKCDGIGVCSSQREHGSHCMGYSTTLIKYVNFWLGPKFDEFVRHTHDSSKYSYQFVQHFLQLVRTTHRIILRFPSLLQLKSSYLIIWSRARTHRTWTVYAVSLLLSLTSSSPTTHTQTHTRAHNMHCNTCALVVCIASCVVRFT